MAGAQPVPPNPGPPGRVLAQCQANLDTCEASAFVPQTGQTSCWDSFGTPILDCSGTGQDGNLQAGVPAPTPHFTDNMDETFTDNRSGLTWLENADCPGGNRTWQEALDDVADLNNTGMMNGNNCGDTGNQTAWRLPNRFEFESLLNLENDPPKPSGNPFMGTTLRSAFYWSSTTAVAFGTDTAWRVSFGLGGVLFGNKSTPLRVLAVRGP